MKKAETRAPIRSWASERLPRAVQTSLDRLANADDVRRVAVMPDVHLARDVCVGTVFATTDLVYPDAIGGDIGCGMAAVAFAAHRSEVSDVQALRLLKAIRAAVPIQRQRGEAAERLASALPPPDDLTTPRLRAIAESNGASQIGTLGTGNHFLELQVDEDDRLWLMVHSGSRGLGQAIRGAHVEHAARGRVGLACLRAGTAEGDEYLRDMGWARRFAAANREAMLAAVGATARDLFGWSVLHETFFDCDHNHIVREEHGGAPFFVHRKGAMAAWPGMAGIVPGSMATASFHVTGRGVADALCSSAHGAGRAMTRTEARRRVNRTRLIDELRGVVVDPRTVHGLAEEAPSAYKDVHAVMKAQRKLVRVARVLRPIVTHKGTGR